MAIPDEEVMYCNIPIEVATAEATQLVIVVTEDREMLIGAGIEPIFVDTLESRSLAFTYAAAKYQAMTASDQSATKKWKELAPKGYELQRYLTRNLGFAYRKDKELTQAVAKIREGRGNQDMVLDLLALSILAEENPEPLAKMPIFDAAKPAEAKAMHTTLSNLLARSTIDPKEVAQAKKELDRAYTYYKLAADEVKEHGQFIFEGTDRYQSYISNYRHNLGKMNSGAAAADNNTTTPPTVPAV
jgi:hypothetical protein